VSDSPVAPLRLALACLWLVEVNWPPRIMRSVELCVQFYSKVILLNLTADEARAVAEALLRHVERLEANARRVGPPGGSCR
jgi:hypothetical protein